MSDGITEMRREEEEARNKQEGNDLHVSAYVYADSKVSEASWLWSAYYQAYIDGYKAGAKNGG